MIEDEQIDRFVKDPSLLLATCRQVIDQLDAGSPDTMVRDQEAHLREIAGAIDRLEKTGYSVPDMLRAEKTRLVAAIAVQRDASEALRQLEGGLQSIVDDLRTRLGPGSAVHIGQMTLEISGGDPAKMVVILTEPVTFTGSNKMEALRLATLKLLPGKLSAAEYPRERNLTGAGYVVREIPSVKQLGRPKEIKRAPRTGHQSTRTRQEAFREHIISALRRLGGSASVADVLEEMRRQLKGKLLPGDLEWRDSANEYIWQNNVRWERSRMTREGALRRDSPRGIWELGEDYK